MKKSWFMIAGILAGVAIDELVRKELAKKNGNDAGEEEVCNDGVSGSEMAGESAENAGETDSSDICPDKAAGIANPAECKDWEDLVDY